MWQKYGNTSEHTLLHESQCQHLEQFLQNLRLSYEPDCGEGAAARGLVFDLLFMHVFAQFDHLELLVGKDGLKGGQSASKLLQGWIKGHKSRRAAWHAGQVINAFQKLLLRDRTEFHAVAFYQASVVLWAFGMLSDVHQSDPPLALNSAQPSTLIYLDEPDNLDVQKWIRFGVGVPSILGAVQGTASEDPQRKPVSLYRPAEIVDANRKMLVELFQKKNGGRDIPAFVENIGSFMFEVTEITRTAALSKG